MSLNYLRYLYLAHLSKPVGDRVLYRAVRGVPARRILEIGISCADRTLRLVNFAQRLSGAEAVRYAAIDLFEARGSDQATGLSLKDTHRLLSTSGAKVQLIPGDPAQALPRAANSLVGTDLIIIGADYDVPSLGRAWFYVPRMLHPATRVYLESRAGEGNQTTFRLMAAAEIELLASGCRRRAA